MKHHSRILLAVAAVAAGADVGTGQTAPTEKPVQPTTPEQLRDLKLTQAIEQKPSYDTLLKVRLATLTGWITQGFISAGNTLKAAATELKSKAKPLGKMLAAAKVLYAQAQDAGDLSKDVSFVDYIYKINGTKPQDTASWNHAQQCAVVFAELVLTGRMTERDYDNRAADALAKACTILNAVKKNGGDLNSPIVTELIDILLNSEDPERMPRLNKLKNKVLGKETVNSDGTGKALDFPNFDAIVRRGAGLDFNGVSGLAHLASVTKEMVPAEKREDVLKSIMFSLTAAMDAINAAVGPKTQETWLEEYDQLTAPVEIKKAA